MLVLISRVLHDSLSLDSLYPPSTAQASCYCLLLMDIHINSLLGEMSFGIFCMMSFCAVISLFTMCGPGLGLTG